MGQLVNHTVNHLSGGVTQQFDEAAFEVQVREMENCVPSISRGIFRRNPISSAALLDPTLNLNDYFVHTYDRGTDNEQYMVFIGNGHYGVINVNTKALVGSGNSSYLLIPSNVSPKDAFSIVTVGDFSFIANKYITVQTSAVKDGIVDSHKSVGVYWINRTSATMTASRTEGGTISGNLIEGYKYSLNGQESFAQRDTRPGSTAIDKLRGEQIALDLGTKLGYNVSGTFVYKSQLALDAAWDWSDSAGNEASFGFKGLVQRADQLPGKMPNKPIFNGLTVNVTQGTDNNSYDDFWLKYQDDVWVETRKPGMRNTLAANTMPHVIVRGSDGIFVLSEYTTAALGVIPGVTELDGWATRLVGDENSCPMPSFVGNTISQVFFHKNRLGVISKDNIVLSENGNYGNFFNTTIRIIPDTDPIDITIATTDVSYINYVISTNNALILFANDAQFVLSASQSFLTPLTATIDVVSRYNCSNMAAPRAIGNKVYFIAESGGSSQLFMFNVTEGVAQTEASNLSQHLPSYIPKDIRYIVGHSNLGYVFMWSEQTPKDLYVYNQSIVGGQLAQSAYHKWTFAKDIAGVNVLDNNVYITFKETTTSIVGGIIVPTTSYFLGSISLELPTSIVNTVYLDTINGISYEYESLVSFNKWLIKDANNNGTKKGRLQIRDIQLTVDKNSKYTVYVYDDGSEITSNIGLWDDTLTWNDTLMFSDFAATYTVATDNNPVVFVMGNSINTNITFTSDRVETSKGFILATVNFEGFYNSTSQRY